MDFKIVDVSVVANRRRRSKWRALAAAVSKLSEYVPGQMIELVCPEGRDVGEFANCVRCVFKNNQSFPPITVTHNRELGVIYISRVVTEPHQPTTLGRTRRAKERKTAQPRGDL